MSDERDRSIERQIFLRSLYFTRPLASTSELLARAMRDRSFPAGTVLFRRGEATTHLFWVVRGDVEMTRDGDAPWKLVPPSVVGIMDFLQDRPRERTATALTDVDALSLSAEDYVDIMEDDFEFTRNAVRRMTASLHRSYLERAPTGAFAEPREPPTPPPSRPLNLVERTLVLHAVPLLRALGVQGVTRLARLGEERRFPEGARITRRDEPASSLLIVARGLVQATREDPHIEARFGFGALLGGYADLACDVRQFDAVALAPSSVLSVRKDDLFDFLEDHSEMARATLGVLSSEHERMLADQAAATRARDGGPKAPSPSGADAVAEAPERR